MEEKKKILIVEDEAAIAELEKDYLELSGFQVETEGDGEKGLKKALEGNYDLLILDLMLPGRDGFSITQEVRSKKDIPILLVSARRDDIDKIRGLGLGADDYMTKPFSASELVARVKAVLRRSQHVFSPPLEEDKEKEGGEDLLRKGKYIAYEDLVINLSNYAVHYKGKAIDMPPKELELLYFLASSPNQVFTREQLLDHIWGYEFAGDSRTVDVHIKRLREKLPQVEEWEISTVWGIGYKFRLG